MEMYHITIMLENHLRFMCCTAEVDQEGGLENSLLKALKKDSGSNVTRAWKEGWRRVSGAAGGLTISLSDHRLY